MQIIGISGPPCSGKDTAAEYIESEYGFRQVSTGDLLREKARQLNLELGRTTLQLLGAKLRLANDGQDPLLDKALHEAEVNTVFTGIRTVNAAQTILNTENGSLLYIDAPIIERFNRSLARNRGDHVSYEEFLTQDEAEHYGGTNIDTSLKAIKDIASFVIVNEGSASRYVRHIDEFINTLARG